MNKRVWASLEAGPKEVIEEAFAEGLRRDPERKRRWVVLVDGNKDQLRLVKMVTKKAGVEVSQLRSRPRDKSALATPPGAGVRGPVRHKTRTRLYFTT